MIASTLDWYAYQSSTDCPTPASPLPTVTLRVRVIVMRVQLGCYGQISNNVLLLTQVDAVGGPPDGDLFPHAEAGRQQEVSITYKQEYFFAKICSGSLIETYMLTHWLNYVCIPS